MKFLLFILPLALAAPSDKKRFFLDSVQNLFDNPTVKNLVHQIEGAIGSDATKQACETYCHSIAGFSGMLLCSPLCSEFQTLVQHYSQKRFFLDSVQNLFDNPTVKNLVHQIEGAIGSDATKQACETYCHSIAGFSGMLLCSPLCSEFQTLVQHYSQKRFFLDSVQNLFDNPTVKNLVHQIEGAIGSDATKQACETYCHSIAGFSGMLLCSPLCSEFQTLVQHYSQKRFFLDSVQNLFDNPTVKNLVHQIEGAIGSDATKQACETYCHSIAGFSGMLLCSPLCSEFQTLVQHYSVAKRNVFTSLLNFFNMDELQKVTTQVFDVIGSDATEAKCETECHAVLTADHLLQHGCPLVCHSFQSLVKHFNLGSTTTSTGTVRKNSKF